MGNLIEMCLHFWTPWILIPVAMGFLLPLAIVVLLYITAGVLYIYKFYRRISGLGLDEDNVYEPPLKLISYMWYTVGYIWHGYEIKGVENLPDKSPALLIYYHGAVPIDLYYMMARVHMLKKRVIHNVGDRFLFKFPGFSMIAEAYKVIPGSLESCSSDLKNNNLLAISPGGVYEALFSESYNIMWKNRLGFAKVALNAKVPIIPVYTENVREAFTSISIFRNMGLTLYKLTKFPLTPIFGGLPVKLTTHIGKPIPYDANITPEDLAAKVASSLRELICKDQRIPGDTMQALLDRFHQPASGKKNKLK